MWYTALELRRFLVLAACALALVAGSACRASRPTPEPAPRDIALIPDTEIVRGKFPANVTLERLLREHVTRQDLVPAFVTAATSAFDPRRFRANQPFRLTRSLDGALRAFEYRDRQQSLSPRRTSGGWA